MVFFFLRGIIWFLFIMCVVKVCYFLLGFVEFREEGEEDEDGVDEVRFFVFIDWGKEEKLW